MPDQRIGVDTDAVTAPAPGDSLALFNGASTNRHISPDNLKAWLGEVPATAPAFPFTGDGTATTFEFVHNLGTIYVSAEIHFLNGELVAPARYSLAPKVAAETTTTVVTVDQWDLLAAGPNGVPDGTQLAARLVPASNVGGPRLAKYGLAGHTTGLTVDSEYADKAAFDAAIPVGSDPYVACELFGWPVPSAVVLLEGTRNGLAVEWTPKWD